MAAPPPKPGQPGQPGQPKEAKKGFKRYRWEFKDSNKEFWLTGHAIAKIVTLACAIIALELFESVGGHPLLILLLTMEVSIISFFIFLYSFAINRYMPFIFWPVTEIFNNLFSGVFLVGGMIFAIKARRTVPMSYVTAVILMGVGAIFSFIDVFLQKPHFKNVRLRKSRLPLLYY
ncbi:CKLF-like MARVEL transmembrane domain-containing protein 2 [Meriones unguiculatus]|uniref:CKLF-like MARVEL transmembrane domain-containing protein 2 n=1 Tax=Meriones unguiculatus TaxID=10047 RepID=UPI00293E5BC5|nr:CKLF-like MARVEL transmembrane domain-containing protein 2 [Meriones unguiculatus]